MPNEPPDLSWVVEITRSKHAPHPQACTHKTSRKKILLEPLRVINTNSFYSTEVVIIEILKDKSNDFCISVFTFTFPRDSKSLFPVQNKTTRPETSPGFVPSAVWYPDVLWNSAGVWFAGSCVRTRCAGGNCKGQNSTLRTCSHDVHNVRGAIVWKYVFSNLCELRHIRDNLTRIELLDSSSMKWRQLSADWETFFCR